MLEVVFLCTLNMLNFKRLALIATEKWNKIFWIDTFTSPNTFLYYNFSFGSIPSPHHVHSCAIIIVLDQYIHLTEYILVLHY